MRMCSLANIQNDFSKNSNTLFLKLRKLYKQVIDTGKEFQILGPWQEIVNCLRLVRQECDG